MELKGSKTEANLMEAFAGESQARNKYTYYASQAKKDGYVQISKIFEETANNEKEHAKIWFKLLHGGSIGNTLDNLEDAAQGENYEWTDMYARFAKERKSTVEKEYKSLVKQKVLISGLPYVFSIGVMGFFVAGMTNYFTKKRYENAKQKTAGV